MYVRRIVWRAGYLGPSLAFESEDFAMLRTGVRSLLSSSVAEAAASMRSSHLLPRIAAAACGSAEKAFLS